MDNSGWTPIGDNTNRFTAMFDGNGNTITDLVINRDTFTAGLFGTIGSSGTVRRLGLANAWVTYIGSGDVAAIGSLAGILLGGTIVATRATGSEINGSASQNSVGGLVGTLFSGGKITASYATGTVRGGAGNDLVGGLVGQNDTSTIITASYASVAVRGGDNVDSVGGLIGRNNTNGTILASYATGAVNGDGSSDPVGGLVGTNSSSAAITASYATDGTVSGSSSAAIGKLVGSNSGTITNSYGFSTSADSGGTSGSDLPMGVVSAADLNAANAGTQWTTTPTQVWNFGTASQRPVLQWVTDSDFSCDPTLLPPGQSCGGIIPGQGR